MHFSIQSLLSFSLVFFFFFFLQNDVEAPAYLRTPGYAPGRTKYDISLLIDKHSDKQTELLWKNEWGGDVKFCSHTSNSRGVAILFKNSFQYNIHKEIKDPGGNYIILDISIQNTRLSLVALYGPNADTPTFLTIFILNLN